MEGNDMDLNFMIESELGEVQKAKNTKRTKAYYRNERNLHIARKKGIIKRLSADSDSPYWVYKHEGELSKGKIHCSCPMCRFYGPSYSDMKKRANMKQKVKEYWSGEYDFDKSDTSADDLLVV